MDVEKFCSCEQNTELQTLKQQVDRNRSGWFLFRLDLKVGTFMWNQNQL